MIHRGNWAWWIIAAVIAALILPPLDAILAGIAAFVIYLLSLAVHPFITCQTCDGTGRHAGMVFGYAHRQCEDCGGQGRHRRLGATVLYQRRQTFAERRAESRRDTRRARPM